MKLFPETPALTPRHRARLAPFLGNQKEISAWVKGDRPSTADLKRAVMMVIENTNRPRLEQNRIITDLLVAIQQYERSTIERKIEKILQRRKP